MGARDAFGIRVGFMSTGRGDRERTGLAGMEVFGFGRPLPFARPLAASEAIRRRVRPCPLELCLHARLRRTSRPIDAGRGRSGTTGSFLPLIR